MILEMYLKMIIGEIMSELNNNIKEMELEKLELINENRELKTKLEKALFNLTNELELEYNEFKSANKHLSNAEKRRMEADTQLRTDKDWISVYRTIDFIRNKVDLLKIEIDYSIREHIEIYPRG